MRGEEQCTRAEKGVGMRVCVCVCVTACANVYVGCGDLVLACTQVIAFDMTSIKPNQR